MFFAITLESPLMCEMVKSPFWTLVALVGNLLNNKLKQKGIRKALLTSFMINMMLNKVVSEGAANTRLGTSSVPQRVASNGGIWL